MDELRRLRGLLVTTLSQVDDLASTSVRLSGNPHAAAVAVLQALEQMRDVITSIEPAYEVALLRCEREAQRD